MDMGLSPKNNKNKKRKNRLLEEHCNGVVSLQG